MRKTSVLCFSALVAADMVLAEAAGSVAFGGAWPMKQRDPQKTGRADYHVPLRKQNDTFFDAVLWQKPSPGSPDDGGFSSSSMVFFDGAGPGGADIVVSGYHWQKGVQGMNRHTGSIFWSGLPAGGETIGVATPAFSNDGATVYVVNDATESDEYPLGHPLMAFATESGPSDFRHNGDDAVPYHLGMDSPTIAPDGRIFLHYWVDRPYAGTDDGSSIHETWAASTEAVCGFSDPALYDGGGSLLVVIGSRNGAVIAYDGVTGEEAWYVPVPGNADASPTIDPSNGNIYSGVGDADVYAVGLDKDGTPLWGETGRLVYDYEEGVNYRQWQQAPGCLSHDGATYYFQTHGQEGGGRLFAVATADGSLKWSLETGARGWEIHGSAPIVTSDGIVVVGNDDGDRYFAIRDDGSAGTILDVLDVNPDAYPDAGHARASATIAPEGTLYLPLRTIWAAGNGDGDTPTGEVANVFTAVSLAAFGREAIRLGREALSRDGGNGTLSSVAFALRPASPNPTRGGTTIAFALPSRADVRLEIFDVAGRLVRRLESGESAAGLHERVWDGRDERGIPVSSGAYFARLLFESEARTQRISIVR